MTKGSDIYIGWIEKGLLKSGLNQSGLAKALDRDRAMVSNMLKGKRQIKAKELAVIAEYLGSPVPSLDKKDHAARRDVELFAAAEAVRAKAYAPYSNFQVGTAILADDGNIYVGCNVENAAYPVGNCAEPSAIAAMLAGGGKRIKRVYTTGPGVTPVTPCGGCRQRIREFADEDVVVVSHGVDGTPLEQTIAQLLPHSFGPEFLGR